MLRASSHWFLVLFTFRYYGCLGFDLTKAGYLGLIIQLTEILGVVEDNLCSVVRHGRPRVHAQCSAWKEKTRNFCRHWGLFTRRVGYSRKGVNRSWGANDNPRLQANFYKKGNPTTRDNLVRGYAQRVWKYLRVHPGRRVTVLEVLSLRRQT